MLNTVSKKNTLNRLSNQFGALVMAKEHNTLQGNRGLMMRLVEIEATSTQK
jgi:hypothetical protein